MNEEEQLKNYFDMVDVTFQAGNYQESYQWCNKILELNPNIGLAVALQGKSILFMSTAQNPNFEEAYNYYESAFNLISENLNQDNSFLKNESAEFIENFNVIVARDFSTKFLELYEEIKNNGNYQKREEILLSCEFLTVAFFQYVLVKDPKIEYAKNFVDICRDIFKADKLNEISEVGEMFYYHKDAIIKYMMTLNFAENILKDNDPQYKSIMEERTYRLLISLDK